MAAAVRAIRAKKRKKREAEKLNIEAQDIFGQIDKDGSGLLDHEELAEALGRLGISASPHQVESAINKYASSGSSALDRQSFSLLAADLKKISVSLTASQELPAPRTSSKIANSPEGVHLEEKLPCQLAVRRAYLHPYSVAIVAAVIMGNFIVNIVEKETVELG